MNLPTEYIVQQLYLYAGVTFRPSKQVQVASAQHTLRPTGFPRVAEPWIESEFGTRRHDATLAHGVVCSDHDRGPGDCGLRPP